MNEKDYNIEDFNTYIPKEQPQRRYSSDSHCSGAYLKRKNKRAKKRKTMMFGGLILLILLVVASVFIFKACSTDKGLTGKWTTDNVTVYEFRDNGKGAMILPSATYEFTYTVEENLIRIDFESEFATDKNYTYELKGNKLTLTGEGKYGGVYEMTRMKK